MQIHSNLTKAIIIFIHAFIGWIFCGLTIAIGRGLFSIQTTLIIHAFAAPLFFILISAVYFNKFKFTSPFQTAAWFLAIVLGLDFFLVAPVFEESYAMFASFLGTWLPFGLIFTATLLTGKVIAKWSRHEKGG
jgi:hypothetical protein